MPRDLEAPALREHRDTWLLHATATMCRDRRFLAAGLWGSLGRGDGDDWSDVDLVVVVTDDDVAAVTRDLRADQSALGLAGVVVDLPQNGIAGGAFLSVTYVDHRLPVHVDWYVCPKSAGGMGRDTLELFARQAVSRTDASFAELLRCSGSSETRVSPPGLAVLHDPGRRQVPRSRQPTDQRRPRARWRQPCPRLRSSRCPRRPRGSAGQPGRRSWAAAQALRELLDLGRYGVA